MATIRKVWHVRTTVVNGWRSRGKRYAYLCTWIIVCLSANFQTLIHISWLSVCLLQKSDKGQIFYWKSQTCTRIMRLFDSRLSPCSKTWKLPYFRPFQPDTQILSTLTAFTDLVQPSTDPVPPSTNQIVWWLVLYSMNTIHDLVYQKSYHMISFCAAL